MPGIRNFKLTTWFAFGAYTAILISITVAVLSQLNYLKMPEGTDREETRIVFFAGGDEDFFFSASLAKGALAAAEHLDVDLEIIWSNWDFNKMVIQFKQAIDLNPNGIAIMGHPGDTALELLIAEARRKNILVTSLNVPLPEASNLYRNDGFGFVGQDLGSAGNALAHASVERFGLNSSQTILVLGTAAIPIRGERTKTAVQHFTDQGFEIIYVEKVIFDDRSAAQKWQADQIEQAMNFNPEIALIFDDIDISSSARALKELGLGSEHVPLVGFDLSPEQFENLKDGYIDLLSDQQPYLQGYYSVLQLFLSHNWNFSGLDIDTGSGILTSGMEKIIEPYVKMGIR